MTFQELNERNEQMREQMQALNRAIAVRAYHEIGRIARQCGVKGKTLRALADQADKEFKRAKKVAA